MMPAHSSQPNIHHNRTKQTKNLRVAIVGTGYFSHFHYKAWQRMPVVELVALHCLDATIGKQFQQQYGIESVYTEVSALLEQQAIDLLDVVVPPNAQRPILEHCIHKRIPVVCQKPFGQDLQEAQAIAQLSEQQQSLVVVHENFRFQPWYQHVRELLDESILGELYEIQFQLRPGDGQGEHAYLDRQPYFQQQRRFLVQETAVHLIDVFRYLNGEISGVFAKLDRLNPAIKGEDAGLIIIEFSNGTRGLINANRLADHAAKNPRLTMGELRIEGEKGTITLNGDGELFFRQYKDTQQQALQYTWQDTDFAGDCVYSTNRHIANHLLHRTPLHNTAQAYVRNRIIEEAVYESAATRQWVDLAL